MTNSFVGLTLPQIFQLPQLQSLLLKYWFLGLTSQQLVVAQEQAYFKLIKKNINFANCFTFEMPSQMYYTLLQKIAISLANLNCLKILHTIVNYMKVNKLAFISFQIFGLHYLQLFGKVLEILNEKIMSKIIRKVFINITQADKLGKVYLKSTKSNITKIDLDEFITSDYKSKLIHQNQQKNTPIPGQKDLYQSNHSERQRSITTFPKLTSIQGRMDLKRYYVRQNKLDKSEGGCYPIGEKMRARQKANLSSFMVGGFQIVDYSESINQLHKKLLSKILLNR